MPLLLGALLAAGALAIVLWPLLSPRAHTHTPPPTTPRVNTGSAPRVNAASTADAAEAMIARARDAAKTCWHCHALCPEPDAAYCSTCGAYLPGRCGKCDQPVREIGPRYCTWCGEDL